MPNLWIIFLTGLTTGGLSCLAVQGGLLANVIARETEEEFKPRRQPSLNPEPKNFNSKHELLNFYETHSLGPKSVETHYRKDTTIAISLFLISKIIAYTLLGFLLGWLGTMLQLGPTARGVLMLLIAIFMIGTALRMLNIHPFFNIFNIQPPKFVRTFVRRFSKNSNADYATPIILGALTVLIPCGVTQAMMALAIGTASPIAGALILLSFTLGASPLFFILAYFTTRVGEKLHRHFIRIVAVLVLIFGLYSLESGLNLSGSPVSFGAVKQAMSFKSAEPTPDPERATNEVINSPNQKEAPATEQILDIQVVDSGYLPTTINAKANVPTKIRLTTNNVQSCSRAFVVPTLKIQKVLAETGEETIEIPAQKPGTVRFSCSMGMYSGKILFN